MENTPPTFNDAMSGDLEGQPTGPAVERFEELNLSESVLSAIHAIGWETPTPIQSRSLIHSMNGQDVAGFAQTGTGKTGVFLITVAEIATKRQSDPADLPQNSGKTVFPKAVVIAPTRELAMQINEDAQKLYQKMGLKSYVMYGGSNWEKQISGMSKSPDLVVSTTGRLKDVIKRKVLSLDACEVFICDEADRMFDMGFIDDVEYFYERLPEKAQKLLFSATTSDQVEELAFKYLDEPHYIYLNEDKLTPDAVEQHLILCDSRNKLKVMMGLLNDHKPDCCIIFTNTKLTAEWLQYKLNHNDFPSELITGNLQQSKRTALIKKIKDGKVKCLIATDVASRGLHISGVTYVYNFDAPNDPANYVHRIGRTARAGASGKAYTLLCDVYAEYMEPVKKLLGDLLPDAEWFDPRYNEIVDKADNPLDKRKVDESPKPDRERSAKSFNRDRDKRQGAKRGERGPRNDDRKPSDKQGSGQRRKGGNRKKSGRKPNQHDLHQHRNKDQRKKHDMPIPDQVAASSSGLFGMVKKVFKSFLGK